MLNESTFSDGIDHLRNHYGGDISTAIFDIIHGFPIKSVSICFDARMGNEFSNP